MLRVLEWMKTVLTWWRKADRVISTIEDVTGGDNAESDRRRYSGNSHDRRKAARADDREKAGQTKIERAGAALLELPRIQETGKQVLSVLWGGTKTGSAGEAESAGAGEKSADGKAGNGA